MPSTPVLFAILLAALPSKAPQNDSIRRQDLKADLYFLAGDGFRGRLTGTAQNELACEFLASRFERLGLKGIGPDGSYFQKFLLATASLGPSNSMAVQSGTGLLTLRLRTGFDVSPTRFSASGESKGILAFAGYGIVDPARDRDDYRGLDLSRTLVLVLDHEPGENDPKSPFDGLVMSEAATPWRKVLAAQRRGALGVLFVADVHNHPDLEPFEATTKALWPSAPARIERYSLADWVEQIRIPAVSISPATARLLLGASGQRLEDLARASERRGATGFTDAQTRLSLSTDVQRHVVPDRNVLAAIEGRDPELKDEWVVISCHLDHDGADGERILNGADDNGSGTVALLEIAEAYALAASEGKSPRRSILFAAFNSEERGLLGSWAFVERPPIALDHIVAVLNMDMIGRDEEVPEMGGPRFRGLAVQSAESNRESVNLLGYSRSVSLARVVEQANGAIGLTLKQVLDNNASNLLRRSDQWPFLYRGVPAVFFHTGLHPDYHTTGDRPEKVRYDKMERIARLVHQASWDLAESPDRPRIDGGPSKAATGDGEKPR